MTEIAITSVLTIAGTDSSGGAGILVTVIAMQDWAWITDRAHKGRREDLHISWMLWLLCHYCVNCSEYHWGTRGAAVDAGLR